MSRKSNAKLNTFYSREKKRIKNMNLAIQHKYKNIVCDTLDISKDWDCLLTPSAFEIASRRARLTPTRCFRGRVTCRGGWSLPRCCDSRSHVNVKTSFQSLFQVWVAGNLEFRLSKKADECNRQVCYRWKFLSFDLSNGPCGCALFWCLKFVRL